MPEAATRASGRVALGFVPAFVHAEAGQNLKTAYRNVVKTEALIYKYLFLAITAASPVGEELVSIPLGFYQGLPILPVALVSVLFNFLPAPIILAAAHAGEKNPSVLRFVNFFRREKVVNLAQKYGPLGVALLSPIVGVYSMTICAWMLGMGKNRILSYTLAGIAAYAAAVCALLLGGAKVLATFF